VEEKGGGRLGEVGGGNDSNVDKSGLFTSIVPDASGNRRKNVRREKGCGGAGGVQDGLGDVGRSWGAKGKEKSRVRSGNKNFENGGGIGRGEGINVANFTGG